jgi:uncharacterized protein (UPF0147 family)
MNQEISEIVELLNSLLEDAPYKAKAEIQIAINMFTDELTQEDLIKIQDQLELISNISNIDSYTRNEIYNILSIIEGLI